jgi:protein-serine/threonine kinase
MLAGYLPFDDDPANPEGDNINLLYKYIVSTPLTFPEYVTPHARDLLRRILVPDPRKRADLFEVARHSWLSEYSHVVGFITSNTTTSVDIGETAVRDEDQQDGPLLNRSASVREPSKTSKPPTAVGDLSRKHGNVDVDPAESHPKPSKDNKRRTVQVEYVPPRSNTQRGEGSTAGPAEAARTRARSGSQGPVEVPQTQRAAGSRRVASTEKPLPQDPPRDAQYSQGRRPSSSQRQQGMAPPTRPARDAARAVSDVPFASGPPVSMNRPGTQGSMASTGSVRQHLPNRGSYSQPVAPTVAGTNAQGRMAQPKDVKGAYNISAPLQNDQSEYGQPQVSSKFAQIAGLPQGSGEYGPKTHKRSNTIGSIFGRSGSIFRKSEQQTQEKPKKSYPPVSMTGAVGSTDTSRQSMDSSRRSISFGFGKKRSGSITGGSQTNLQDRPRRFSLLPANFSLKAIGIGKEYGTPGAPPSDQQYESRPDSRGNYLDPPQTSRNISGSTADYPRTADGSYDHARDSPMQDRRATSTASPPQHQRYASNQTKIQDPRSGQFLPPSTFRQEDSALTTGSESSLNDFQQRRAPQSQYPAGFNEYDNRPPPARAASGGRGVLQKNNRKFADAYEQDQNNGWSGQPHSDHAGSSGAARKVMDFFRRRGRDRG